MHVPKHIIIKKHSLVHHGWHYGFSHVLWGLPTVIRPDEKQYTLFPAGWHAFKNPLSFPSSAEPNIWWNEEAAEHINVILVQVRELEKNNAKWEVSVQWNQPILNLNQKEVCVVFIISHVTVNQCYWKLTVCQRAQRTEPPSYAKCFSMTSSCLSWSTCKQCTTIKLTSTMSLSYSPSCFMSCSTSAMSDVSDISVVEMKGIGPLFLTLPNQTKIKWRWKDDNCSSRKCSRGGTLCGNSDGWK